MIMPHSRIATLVRYTLIEALRTRLPWVLLLALGAVHLTAWFLQVLAIAESARTQIAFSAAATRLAMVFVLSLHVVASMVREFNDKGLELTLSFDLTRTQYLIGRLTGFLLLAILTSLVAVAPQLLLAPGSAPMAWGASLALELAIMVTLGMFCVVTFAQMIPSAIFMLSFYVLARSLSAMRLMSDTPAFGAETAAHHVISMLIDGLTLLLPTLSSYAQTSWLADGVFSWSALASNAVQAALYVPLLCAAALFDLHRKNL